MNSGKGICFHSLEEMNDVSGADPERALEREFYREIPVFIHELL